MAWLGGGKKEEGDRKALRLGTLAPVQDLDPRRTREERPAPSWC
jgi:hypothetical protein